MRKLFWFGCIGLIIAAGIVYLAASPGRKPAFQAVGDQAAAPASPVGNRLGDLAAYGLHAVPSSAGAEPAPGSMPPQIIDVCQEQPIPYPWTIGGAIWTQPELIQTGLEVEPVLDGSAEPIGMPQEEPAEELPMPREEPAEELDMPRTVPPVEIEEPAEELDMPRTVPPVEIEDAVEPCPMPGITEETPAEPMARTSEDCPILSFWMSFFKDLMPGADAENTADDGAREDACQEDPHQAEHYPHCPYLGGCPRSTPVCPASGTPRPRKPGEEECEPACPRADPDPESPAQPGIDTMEFRPSDAKDGEFEAKPM